MFNPNFSFFSDILFSLIFLFFPFPWEELSNYLYFVRKIIEPHGCTSQKCWKQWRFAW